MNRVCEISVVTTQQQIERYISNGIQNTIGKAISRIVPIILNKTQVLFVSAIQASQEYNSISDGDLKHELGLVDGKQRLDNIIDIAKNTIHIQKSPVIITKRGLSGKLSILGVPLGYSDLLGSSDATLSTKKYDLPWLDWMLNLGDKIIVRDYFFDLEKTSKSRTGLGIMRGASGSGWRVPPQYSGTIDDNFITRSIDSMLPELGKFIQVELARSIR